MTSSINPDNSSASAKNQNDGAGVTVLYDFSEQGQGNWSVEDDVVMGGRSESHLEITEEGQARFFGHVSLENNGGFCSFQQTIEQDPYVVTGKSAFCLRLKGDGKDYNFRVRTPQGRHSYAFTFPTKANDWEIVTIPFDAMEATYHGEPVDVPNYAGEKIVEIQILIGNGKAEDFELLLEAISVL
ncbi:CIA30 family protein [Neolewinella persica]|uniref:CIA30 family protein n=1 Tax=Neolewinella persica TaxID=70998 RepID=UPI0003A527E3|nr:CIA30 family protein [Neolewinella persica]